MRLNQKLSLACIVSVLGFASASRAIGADAPRPMIERYGAMPFTLLDFRAIEAAAR